MNKSMSIVATAALFAMLNGQAAFAEDSGVNRAAGGVADAVTSPAKVVEGVTQDTASYGPVGVVTGSVKGGVRAASQLVIGAANVGVGVVEAVAEPFAQK